MSGRGKPPPPRPAPPAATMPPRSATAGGHWLGQPGTVAANQEQQKAHATGTRRPGGNGIRGLREAQLGIISG